MTHADLPSVVTIDGGIWFGISAQRLSSLWSSAFISTGLLASTSPSATAFVW
jgi:hypothetical protein